MIKDELSKGWSSEITYGLTTEVTTSGLLNPQ